LAAFAREAAAVVGTDRVSDASGGATVATPKLRQFALQERLGPVTTLAGTGGR
jgi:hypothetical protein